MNRELGHMSSWMPVQRESLERQLRRHCDAEVRFDAVSRTLYSTDASIYQIEPIGVAIPRTRAALAAIVAIAMEQRVPIVPRGGGTSLSGQSIGRGLVIDCRKYLNQILEVNIAEQSVFVEPGVVLAELNRYLAPLGYQFGPDVATMDRANIGGMIGNNSAGARSIRYGMTVDHVQQLDVLLSDGRSAVFGPTPVASYSEKLRLHGLEGDAYRAVHNVVREHEEEIRARFPKLKRRVSGYNLDAMLPPEPPNLAKLIVGSEGTLAMVSAARLRIIPIPRFRGISALSFDRLDDALKRLPEILATSPSAVELLDRIILDLASENPDYRARMDIVSGRPEALLIVEHSSNEPSQIGQCFAELKSIVGARRGSSMAQTMDSEACERIWDLRKTALPLLLAMPGDKQPIAFVEDTAVEPDRLPEFVVRFRQILDDHHTRGSFYGHASVGCLHIRPMLDLRKHTDRRDMVSIAEKVVSLVLEFGGALSGEHGDGLSRSAFNPIVFGPRVYEAFRTVKRAFDPENLLNPGKIVDAPWIIENLRFERRPDSQTATTFTFADHAGIGELAVHCNGNGLCRRENVGTMCPSYMATRDEQHSPRGRANLVRAVLDRRLGAATADSWAVSELDEALDLCLMCKACKTECPSQVDIARVKAEYLHQRWRRRSPRLRDRLIARSAVYMAHGSRWAPISNWALAAWPVRWFLDRFVGIDRRRTLPAYHRKTLSRWFARHKSQSRSLRGRVVLLADCFTDHHQPLVGRAAVTLLELAGYQVHLGTFCCGRTAISKGCLDDALNTIRRAIDRLIPYAEEGVPILGIEPSCILTLADEWRDLVPGDATRLIASRVALVESWLGERHAEGRTDLPAPPVEPLKVLFHGHCHQKAARAVSGAVAALRGLANVDPVVLDVGCCGMAGAFGYESDHYDLSVAIAEQRLLPALRQSPTSAIVTSGFSCRHQIADLARRKPLHPVELIRDRILDQK